MPKHNLLIESGSIGADMAGNRFVYRLGDKDANRSPDIVRLTITLFECPCMRDRGEGRGEGVVVKAGGDD